MEVLDAAVVGGVPLELVVDPLLLHPHVGDHDLPLHVDPDELRQLDPHLYHQLIRIVAHRTYQPWKESQSVPVPVLGLNQNFRG